MQCSLQDFGERVAEGVVRHSRSEVRMKTQESRSHRQKYASSGKAPLVDGQASNLTVRVAFTPGQLFQCQLGSHLGAHGVQHATFCHQNPPSNSHYQVSKVK
eukprot:3225223-Rhodomonas_salina.3